MVATKVMALTGVDMLTDPALMQRAREFLDEVKAGQPYVSPIPVDQKPPVPGGQG